MVWIRGESRGWRISPEAAINYDPRGSFDFLAEGQTGTDIFSYVIADANGGADEAEITISVVGRNDAPSASRDRVMVEGRPPLVLDVLANDDDIDSDDDRGTLGSSPPAPPPPAPSSPSLAMPAPASSIVRAAAALPPAWARGDRRRHHHLHDRRQPRRESTGSALVTVVGRNDAPTAGADQGATDEDAAINLAYSPTIPIRTFATSCSSARSTERQSYRVDR